MPCTEFTLFLTMFTFLPFFIFFNQCSRLFFTYPRRRIPASLPTVIGRPCPPAGASSVLAPALGPSPLPSDAGHGGRRRSRRSVLAAGWAGDSERAGPGRLKSRSRRLDAP